MSINVAIFNILEALTSPLSTFTTSLVSNAFGSAQNSSKSAQNSLFLQSHGGYMIDRLFAPECSVFIQAEIYIKIRVLSLPFVLSYYVIVGFSLGTQQLLASLLSKLIAFFANV